MGKRARKIKNQNPKKTNNIAILINIHHLINITELIPFKLQLIP